eukprot:scaffold1758_cov333-Pavlova_lutheri.AAC.18
MHGAKDGRDGRPLHKWVERVNNGGIEDEVSNVVLYSTCHRRYLPSQAPMGCNNILLHHHSTRVDRFGYTRKIKARKLQLAIMSESCLARCYSLLLFFAPRIVEL